MLSNFPIELFISNQAYVTDVMGEKTGDESTVLGLLIDESVEVAGSAEKAAPLDKFACSQLQTVQRVMKLINTVTQAHDKKIIEAYEGCVIRLPAKGSRIHRSINLYVGLSQPRRLDRPVRTALVQARS